MQVLCGLQVVFFLFNCQTPERGGASLMAARELADKGYRVKTMIGGIRAYRGKNLESYVDKR